DTGPRAARGTQPVALFGTDRDARGADEVDAALEPVAIDDDPDDVAVDHLADRPSGQRLGTDVPDARARRHAGEARIRENGDVLAERQVLEGGRDLVDLLHAGAERAPADQHEHVAGLKTIVAAALDGGDRVALAGEHARGSGLAIDAVRVDDRRID